MCVCGGQDCPGCYPGSKSDIIREEKIAYISAQEGIPESVVEEWYDLDDYVFPEDLRQVAEEEEWERERDQ